jgi:hypothetical protein
MTTPNIVPAKYAGNKTDFLRAKQDAGGGNRTEVFSVDVPVGTAINAIVGIVPFRKGASFCHGASKFYIGDIGDNALVFDVGYIYDDQVTYTSDPDAFASALTTGQAGGLVSFDEHAGLTWVADADGWIAITLSGSVTNAAGVIKGQAVLFYDA